MCQHGTQCTGTGRSRSTEMPRVWWSLCESQLPKSSFKLQISQSFTVHARSRSCLCEVWVCLEASGSHFHGSHFHAP